MELSLSKPHGGTLVNRILPHNKREQILAETDEFPKIVVDKETANDVRNIAEGVFSPLEGFMGREDYLRVVHEGRLINGIPWTIPIMFNVPKDICSKIAEGEDVVLTTELGQPVALLHVSELYSFDKKTSATLIFGTRDIRHPGVEKLLAMGDVLIGGKVDLIATPHSHYERYRFSPAQTREFFEKMNWGSVAGFQTRNIPHLGHEYIQKTALTFVDGLFLNPIIGKKKSGDFKDDVIIATYEALIKHYFPENRTILGVLQTEMRYAGPKEAVFHAIIRKNFGCTHFIVGRDHAGVGDFYPLYAAHEIFKEYPDLGVTPLFFPSVFFCDVCKNITNDKGCPHSRKCHQEFSGTRIREELRSGRFEEQAIRPEIADILAEWKDPLVEGQEQLQ